jgi:hypothetical protein
MPASHDGQVGGPLPFLIRRAPTPTWILDHGPSTGDRRIYHALGEQAEWGFATPWVYRALASPDTGEPMPEAPRPGVQQINRPVAYWSALLQLLVYRMGWVCPARGLRWWYDNGKPVVDRTFELISQVWDADGQLDWFAAWLWRRSWLLEPGLVEEATGHVLDSWTPLLYDDHWMQARSAEAGQVSGERQERPDPEVPERPAGGRLPRSTSWRW